MWNFLTPSIPYSESALSLSRSHQMISCSEWHQMLGKPVWQLASIRIPFWNLITVKELILYLGKYGLDFMKCNIKISYPTKSTTCCYFLPLRSKYSLSTMFSTPSIFQFVFFQYDQLSFIPIQNMQNYICAYLNFMSFDGTQKDRTVKWMVPSVHQI
jgi:hypothetical protein